MLDKGSAYASLRSGKRPKGKENAMIIKRVLKRLRDAWPETRIILRGTDISPTRI